MCAQSALVLQAGGPTAVINASLAAVVADWKAAHGRLYGARLGLQGLARGEYVALDELASADVARLAAQPGAALGSGRYRLAAGDIERALGHLKSTGIDTLFLIGGNGTMAAAEAFATAAPEWLQVIGIPKSIDNDLHGTDAAPGYGSAARYVAISVRDAALDLHAMSSFDDVIVIETMGRHSGWLAAASALARQHPPDPPHLILLPEAPVDEDAVLERIVEVHAARGTCLVVVAEGLVDRDGALLGEKLGTGGRDDRGQYVLSLAPGVGAWLTLRIQKELGLRCRQVRPNTLQRVSSAHVSPVDRELAWLAGTAAVSAAMQGRSNIMIGVGLDQGECKFWDVSLTGMADGRRDMPAHMIDAPAWDVTQSFLDYARPLVGEMPSAPIIWG